LLEQHSPPD
jgi:hypothetical protein